MPTVNIFQNSKEVANNIQTFLSELKSFIAKELTCGDIRLRPEEVSVRLITVESAGMIAPVEVEVTAHAFGERIARQDEISLHIREFMQQRLGDSNDVRVWLLLPQLGHSWE